MTQNVETIKIETYYCRKKAAKEIGGKAMETGFEMVSFEIIANAGDARSFAFGALEAAKAGNFEEAEELLKKSDAAAVLAHHSQTDLLVQQANGTEVPVDVLMVHAQDHLMTSMLAVELIKELITLYKNK